MRHPGSIGAVVVALGAVLLATGCSSAVRPEVLQAWVGRPAAALEQDWGPPTRQVEGDPHRILIYEEVERATPRDFQSPSGRGTSGTYFAAQLAEQDAYRAPAVYVRSYLFWVNREGTIVQSARRDP